jgi:hypothetical protein
MRSPNPRKRTGEAVKPKIGRPAGKHSSPEYRQIGVFVRRDTYDAVKERLKHEGGEVSELVQMLFDAWLG